MKVTTGHVGINVTSLERSKQFYMAAFGLDIMGDSTEEGKKFVFLTDGERLVLTLWEQSVGRFDPKAPGLHHLSFEMDSVEKLREAEAKIKDLGAEFLYDGIVAHGEGAPSGAFYFEDPDGTRLEIYSADAGEGHSAPSGEAPT